MSCTVKIRLPSGESVEGTFNEDDPLQMIAEMIRAKAPPKFLLSIPSPRRIFTDNELKDLTVKQAGLSPRGLIMVQAGIATNMKLDTTPVQTVKPGVKHVASAQEYETLKATKDRLVVVDFSAEWCGPCKMIAPVYEQLAANYTNVVFLHVDVDKVQVQDAKDVSGIPTFKFFKNGKLLSQFSGADTNQLTSTVEKLK